MNFTCHVRVIGVYMRLDGSILIPNPNSNPSGTAVGLLGQQLQGLLHTCDTSKTQATRPWLDGHVALLASGFH